jgi:pyruvate/2-oxoglutarate dehydrogenase complex dihydrolipoamide dehydrogenase (E3) component
MVPAIADPREIEAVQPLDLYNEQLLANVHPPDWANPEPDGRYNLVVLGAGTAGLVTAAGAAGLGAKVALVERNLMGGDCLNVGCVPSKCILRSSRAVAGIRNVEPLGVHVTSEPEVDFSAVMERMRKLRARISPNDSAARFRELGVDVFFGEARFADSETVKVGEHRLKFKKAVIATGARPVAPPIEGLAEAGYLTNETVFSLTQRPERFVAIGGGPIGCELAQAFQRLGSRVTLIEMAPQFLPREDPDAAALLLESMKRDGITVLLNTTVKKITSHNGKKVVHAIREGNHIEVPADQILVGVGRQPNVESLGLEGIGVEVDKARGVAIDNRLRTTNPRIYAAGDVCLAHKFTHTADAAARIVIRNALFFGRSKVSDLVIPWCTYTDPEIAHVGLYEQEARDRGIEVDTFKQEFAHVDRAIAEGDDEGFVKIHVRKGTDQILGATIVAPHAGEMISELTVAMVGGVGLSKISTAIHPYPTQAEAIKKIADAYMRTKLTPTIKKWFSRWLSWTR